MKTQNSVTQIVFSLVFFLVSLCYPYDVCSDLNKSQTPLTKSTVLAESLNKAQSLYSQFPKIVEKFLKTTQQQIDKKPLWIGKKLNIESPSNGSPDFKPFVRKIVIPEKSKLFCWGDLHGGLYSLVNALRYLQSKGVLNDSLTLTQKNCYLIFLGDFVDRGAYGVEVLYLLMNLYIQNPRQVIFVRGNHEDLALNKRYGFTQELRLKPIASTIEQRITLIEHFYHALPVACYLSNGKSIVQLCHGGMDICYQPHTLLKHKTALYELITPENYSAIQTLAGLNPRVMQQMLYYLIHRSHCILHKLSQHIYQAHLCYNYMNEKGVIDKLSYHLPQILKNPRNINNILEEAGLNSHLLRPLFCEKTPCKNILNKCLLFTPKHLTDIGFAWSDFLVNEQDFADFDSSCRWAYGEILCGDLFAFQGICGVFRAHQHYGSMMDALLSHGGATALWNHNNSEATVNLKKNAVCTFQVAPSSGMVNLDYDPVSMVTTAQNFTDWTLHKIQVPRRASHY